MKPVGAQTSAGLARWQGMHVFVDFEASSLGKRGYPIEVAWVFESGEGESHLIRPAPQWIDWDEGAEALHRISRAQLQAEGEAHDHVARRMIDVLSGHDLFASAPSWDGKWLSALLRASGLPRHALRLRDSELAQRQSAAERLATIVAGDRLSPLLDQLVAQARVGEDEEVRHRAYADAEQERQRWLSVIRLAEAWARKLQSLE